MADWEESDKQCKDIISSARHTKDAVGVGFTSQKVSEIKPLCVKLADRAGLNTRMSQL
jgi:hypothetical protein